MRGFNNSNISTNSKDNQSIITNMTLQLINLRYPTLMYDTKKFFRIMIKGIIKTISTVVTNEGLNISNESCTLITKIIHARTSSMTYLHKVFTADLMKSILIKDYRKRSSNNDFIHKVDIIEYSIKNLKDKK